MSDFNGTKIDRQNPKKSDRGDIWDVYYPLIIDPPEAQFPEELADTIFSEWGDRVKQGGQQKLCYVEIVNNEAHFAVPKEDVGSLEHSLAGVEILLVTKIAQYKSKVKREETSETDLDEILGRLKKS